MPIGKGRAHGDAGKFVVACMQPVEGATAEAGDLYERYHTRSVGQGFRAFNAKKVEEELISFLDDVGFKRAGKVLYGLQLADAA